MYVDLVSWFLEPFIVATYLTEFSQFTVILWAFTKEEVYIMTYLMAL